MTVEKTAFLVLADGSVYRGKAFGAAGTAIAEVVFTTGMTGYLETLTDKSYHGQIVVQTFPLIGNYGMIPADFESEKAQCSAYVVKQWCGQPSNFRAEGNLDAFLKEQGIPGLYDIDTRSLVRRIRESGVMNGMITDDLNKVDMAAILAYRIEHAVDHVTAEKPYKVPLDDARFHVALMDYGLKENIIRKLQRLNCAVTVFPARSGVADVLAADPDGILLSNGPGDPEDNPVAIATLRELQRCGIPILGICLGHQLLALANGFQTAKLKYGHRGANQPVRDTTTGRVYITSQNHGYAVLCDSVDPKIARNLFVNVNDHTCEGIEFFQSPAFTAQFHPEACGGPQDTSFLFDRFLHMMEVRRHAN